MTYKKGDQVYFTQERVKEAKVRQAVGKSGLGSVSDEYILANQYVAQTISDVNNIVLGSIHYTLDGHYGFFRHESIETRCHALPEELFTI